ncbi:unnamed protein product [Symbiodinium natans]|uniref:NYN domain-containing protein n=1 Tax=Symbiodinium natans TaxID=878477 RepID=A0A812QFS6_9DINO|nr:unnamed protein product [Symbiodinium natans]
MGLERAVRGPARDINSPQVDRDPAWTRTEPRAVSQALTASSKSNASGGLAVDVNNIRGRGREARFDMTSVSFLCWLLAWAGDSTRCDFKEVVAVLDHGQRPGAYDLGAASVAFAGPRRTADDLICLLARRLALKHLVVVATSDRLLRKRARSSPESPKQQLRRIRHEQVGGSRGFATWVSSTLVVA